MVRPVIGDACVFNNWLKGSIKIYCTAYPRFYHVLVEKIGWRRIEARSGLILQ